MSMSVICHDPKTPDPSKRRRSFCFRKCQSAIRTCLKVKINTSRFRVSETLYAAADESFSVDIHCKDRMSQSRPDVGSPVLGSDKGHSFSFWHAAGQYNVVHVLRSQLLYCTTQRYVIKSRRVTWAYIAYVHYMYMFVANSYLALQLEGHATALLRPGRSISNDGRMHSFCL